MNNWRKIPSLSLIIFSFAWLLANAPQASGQGEQTTLRITIRLSVVGNDVDPSGLIEGRPLRHKVRVLDQRITLGSPQRDRSPLLTEDKLVVRALGQEGQELAEIFVPDSRLLRSEGVDEHGKLKQKRHMYRASSELIVFFPGDMDISAIQVLQPHWTGNVFILESLGTVKL